MMTKANMISKMDIVDNLALPVSELGKPWGVLRESRTDVIIQAAMTYSLEDVVEQYASDYSLPMDVALEHEKELKRYLALAAIFPQRAYGMIGPVDKIWHTFILSTRKYSDFCQSVAGHYLHHYPERFYGGNLDAENANSNDTLDWYERFLEDYEDVFGEESPRHIWPRPVDYAEIRAALICRVCGTDPWL